MTRDEVKQLEVGDNVRCISTKYCHLLFEVGNQYTVMSKDPVYITSESHVTWYLDFCNPTHPYWEDFERVREFDIDCPYGHETRNSSPAEVLVEKDGRYWGRVKILRAWVPYSWNLYGKVYDEFDSDYDIVNKSKPKPNVVEIDLEVSVSLSGNVYFTTPARCYEKLSELSVGEYKVTIKISEEDKI